MIIHHIRNATLIIESQDKMILVDPMIGKKGTAAPPFSFIRFKPKRNPIVELPENAMELIHKTTHCLITHLHADHFDKAAIAFLSENKIPVICSYKDEAEIRQKGIHVSQVIHYWEEQDFFGGTIQGIPARHGYGYVAKPMGNVMGYHIELPNEKSIYISSDTIYTDDVQRVLTELKPDVSVVASGSAQLDVFQPLLMRMADILKFVKTAPGKVIANHLEAVNHCPTKRTQLKKEIDALGLADKVFIPNDGDNISF